jgi:Fe-S-cluster containining protein
MAEFVCTLCGRCCMGMGKYVHILGNIGPSQIICRHGLGNETVYATIEKQYRDEFNETRNPPLPGWCPFLRRREDGETYACIIYQTRPRFCREFKCARIRILDASGRTAGIVKGRRTLSSREPALTALWDQEIAPLSIDDDSEWQRRARRCLERNGYRVEIYD